MKIGGLKINYYKSIKQPIVLDSLPVNFFIGQNNSGKSNILDAIEFALTAPANDSSLFYHKAEIELNLVFTDDEQAKYQLPSKAGLFTVKNNEREFVFHQLGGQMSSRVPYNRFLAQITGQRIKRLDSLAFTDFKQIEEDFQTLSASSLALEKFTKNLKDHFPKISATQNALDINYEHEGLYEGKRRVTIDRMGSGFRRIFTILLYIFHPDYDIILINEPEIHLHPAMIEKLLWAMQNSQDNQIFATTHSPLFITPITLPQVVRVVRGEESTEAYSLPLSNYNYQRLIQELNADNLEMFFADKVVLVEGSSDRLLTRGLIDKFYEGDKDIKVVETHGKGNINIYADLLNIFKIPFIIVLDRDAVKSHHLAEIMRHLKINLPIDNDDQLIAVLKKENIFVFANGSLEANYPKKYQQKDSKTANALQAANLITPEEFNSKTMRNLREIIFSL
ncbi:MAG: hypothetical protein COU21_00805 [Candidatus Komeilibacteria bacterium CG10_big_fil_rev_8_21_14_0_10_36_65]|nr:MAG: hypothetical protein COU21_00805 [Candidatus Komeilibacteria bacterium CG10_big_fil_rev_8_21_14_0_10_36_65]PJC55764.1 MAG: hypothetical protein CO027_00380 [Candidatus Komeilibacteria bacterium CG_4_9_14_0_2_um_filter_36_13]